MLFIQTHFKDYNLKQVRKMARKTNILKKNGHSKKKYVESAEEILGYRIGKSKPWVS